MNMTFEQYIEERIRLWHETKVYEDTFLDEETGKEIEYYKNDYDKAVKLIEDLDKNMKVNLLIHYVLHKSNDLDKWTTYKITELHLVDAYNGYIEAKRIGKNLTEHNHRRLFSRKGIFKSTTELEVSDLFNWHKTNDPERKEKFLYIFKNEMGRIKIGQAISVEQRNHNIKIQAGISIEILNMVDESAKHESILHRMFKHKKYAGEWFNLSESEIDWLCSLSKENIKSKIKTK